MALQRDMTSGKPLRHLLLFALPLSVGSTLQLLYTFADSAVVGRLIGLDAFAAVGAAGQYYWFLFGAIQGLSHGFSARIAQCFGAHDEIGTSRAVAMSFTLLIGIALIAGWLAGALLVPALRLQNMPEQLIPMAADYLRIMLFGLPVSCAYLGFGAAFLAMGDSKTPLYALIFSTLLNIGLDVTLVPLTGLGVKVVAMSTLIAQAASCLWCLLHLRRAKLRWTQASDWRFDLPTVRALFRLGGPTGFRDAVTNLGGVWVQSCINAYGAVFIAGTTAATKLYSLMEIPASGMEGAVATFVAQNFGANRLDRVRQSISAALKVMLASSVVVVAVLYAFRRPLLTMFIAGAEAEAALEVGMRTLSFMLIALPTLYLLLLYRPALVGTGNALLPTVSGFVELAARLFSVLVLPHFIGVWGVYMAVALGWPAACIQLYIGYRIHMRRIERVP